MKKMNGETLTKEVHKVEEDGALGRIDVKGDGFKSQNVCGRERLEF